MKGEQRNHSPMAALASLVAVTVVALLLCVGKVGAGAVDSASPKPPGSCSWKLVFSDEFASSSLDESKWMSKETCKDNSVQGNGQLQCYTRRESNLFLAEGALHLHPAEEKFIDSNGTTQPYTSAHVMSRVDSDADFSWTFGRFQIRARIPSGRGLWPALWMLPSKNVYGPWAASGEIDILEARGNSPSLVQASMWYGDKWPFVIGAGSGPSQFDCVTDFSADFHVYAVEWSPSSIDWYIDNVKYYSMSMNQTFYPANGFGPDARVNYTSKNPYSAAGQPFDQAFKLIMNVAVGGNLFTASQQPVPGDVWSQPDLIVDYVRVYQRVDNGLSTGSEELESCFGIKGGAIAKGPEVQCVADSTQNSSTICFGYAQVCSAMACGNNAPCTLSNANTFFAAYYAGNKQFGDPYCYWSGAAKLVATPNPAPNGTCAPQTESYDTSSSSGSSGMSMGMIIGIAVGAAVGGLLLIGVCCYCIRKRRSGEGDLEVVYRGSASASSAPREDEVKLDYLPKRAKSADKLPPYTSDRGSGVVPAGSRIRSCPLCSVDFDRDMTSHDINEHIDNCTGDTNDDEDDEDWRPPPRAKSQRSTSRQTSSRSYRG